MVRGEVYNDSVVKNKINEILIGFFHSFYLSNNYNFNYLVNHYIIKKLIFLYNIIDRQYEEIINNVSYDSIKRINIYKLKFVVESLLFGSIDEYNLGLVKDSFFKVLNMEYIEIDYLRLKYLLENGGVINNLVFLAENDIFTRKLIKYIKELYKTL